MSEAGSATAAVGDEAVDSESAIDTAESAGANATPN